MLTSFGRRIINPPFKLIFFQEELERIKKSSLDRGDSGHLGLFSSFQWKHYSRPKLPNFQNVVPFQNIIVHIPLKKLTFPLQTRHKNYFNLEEEKCRSYGGNCSKEFHSKGQTRFCVFSGIIGMDFTDFYTITKFKIKDSE